MTDLPITMAPDPTECEFTAEELLELIRSFGFKVVRTKSGVVSMFNNQDEVAE